jgi:hypothetical protein
LALPFWTIAYCETGWWALDFLYGTLNLGAPVIDLYRLCRAVHLDVEELAEGLYAVSGAGHQYTVHAGYPCPCADRVRPCKHELAIKLYVEADRDVIRSLRPVVRYPGARRLIRAA